MPELSNLDYVLPRAYQGVITEPAELAAFMGQGEAESGQFGSMDEGLGCNGERLVSVVPGRIQVLSMIAMLLLGACKPAAQTAAAETTAPSSTASVSGVAQAASGSRPSEDPPSPLSSRAPKMPATTQQTDIPGAIDAFLKPGDVLLAYKPSDLSGDGEPDAVIVVRHPAADVSQENRCTLEILLGKGNAYELVGRSDKAVDCTYNNFAKSTADKPDDLNDYLELGPAFVSYSNEKERGHDNYSFRFSAADNAWLLSKVDVTYPQSNEKIDDMDVFQAIASYPEAFGKISMAAFDPRQLESVLKNKMMLLE